MHPITLTCPQCGSPLPRRALWRIVTCGYCSADVTHSQLVVSATDFHAAWLRSRAAIEGSRTISCAGSHYKPLAHLGTGERASVLLAERIGAPARRVLLKIAHPHVPASHLEREKEVLDQLQAETMQGSAYFTQRLPQAVAIGSDTTGQQVLVLRHPTGFWGSLEDARRCHGSPIDPRHAVWMWRRVLEVLAYVHASGWAHCRLGPEHLLVHPADHGVLMISWAAAWPCRPGDKAQVRDVMDSARAIRALLDDAIPAPLAQLLERAGHDSPWCARQGADGIDKLLGGAARESFGPPRFIHFSPTPRAGRPAWTNS